MDPRRANWNGKSPILSKRSISGVGKLKVRRQRSERPSATFKRIVFQGWAFSLIPATIDEQIRERLRFRTPIFHLSRGIERKCFKFAYPLLCRHARKYFTGLEDNQLSDVQRVMGLLAFNADTQIPVYKVSSLTLQHKSRTLFYFGKWEQTQGSPAIRFS